MANCDYTAISARRHRLCPIHDGFQPQRRLVGGGIPMGTTTMAAVAGDGSGCGCLAIAVVVVLVLIAMGS